MSYWKLVFAIVFLLVGGFLVLSLWPTNPSQAVIRKAKSLSDIHSGAIRKNKYILVVDYDLPFLMKRLWVIDSGSGEIVLRSHVSHAWRSGFWRPTRFSNVPESRISSKGCFVTGESYYGQFGLGMRLDGLEPHNNNVRRRALVFHPSWGPWSGGCFMTFPWINQRIIELTKGGSFIYVHCSNRL